jgi:metal-responsive CopG/Arc/MetJ family transcriptional regulator
MTAKAVQVSIDVELLRRIDADPETRKRGRSAFIRSAVSSYLGAKQRRKIDAAIAAAYAGAAGAMLSEAEGLFDAQAWPDD